MQLSLHNLCSHVCIYIVRFMLSMLQRAETLVLCGVWLLKVREKYQVLMFVVVISVTVTNLKTKYFKGNLGTSELIILIKRYSRGELCVMHLFLLTEQCGLWEKVRPQRMWRSPLTPQNRCPPCWLSHLRVEPSLWVSGRIRWKLLKLLLCAAHACLHDDRLCMRNHHISSHFCVPRWWHHLCGQGRGQRSSPKTHYQVV